MGVKVEEDWRYKKVRSERASRSAFAYKINNKLKMQEKSNKSYGSSTKAPDTQEVIVKITGGARSKKGIKNVLEYISKNWEEEIIDSNGIKYKTKEEMMSAVSILQDNVAISTRSNQTKEEKLTHNMVFSAPRIAKVKKEDALEGTIQALKAKYSDNYFVATYHDETNNPHVHIVLNINKDTGERINIRKKDLRDVREYFCENLKKYGYDVKATKKYGYEVKEYEELLLRQGRNTYEVIEFGTASYKLDRKNDKSSYLVYKTSNNKEVTIWGKEILEEMISKNIKKGDIVKIERTGQVDIKVPVYDSDGATIISWKIAKRNNWKIEKAENNIDSTKIKYQKEIKLNNQEQAMKQLKQKEKFNHEKEQLLDSLDKKNLRLESKLAHKQQKWGLNF